MSSAIPSPILEIMHRRGVRVSVDEFQSAVNVTFHEFESEVYDLEHADMWESLPLQFDLLVNDCLQHFEFPPQISLLDIGCGTGLAFSSLLKTGIGDRIASIDLLDTSPAMLERARQRASQLQVLVRCHQGLLSALPSQLKYDLIVTCSVLHHVPDIPRFLQEVRTRQTEHGVFLHLQDPNGDYLADCELRQRMALAAKRPLPEFCYRLTPARISRRIMRMIFRTPADDYIAKTNRALLRSGVIASWLTVPELFAITDIHVQDGKGISISQMKSWMTEYDCIAQRSYGYFGQLASTLSPKLQRREEHLIASRAPNGFHVGAAWRLR